MAYKIEMLRKAGRALQNLPNEEKERLDRRILLLGADPLAAGAVKLKGFKAHYRVRVGDYRIVFYIESREKVVVVTAIGHRRDTYRNLLQ